MRLDRLRVHGIGPFADADLDLTGVEGRVVAICGANGAGKCLPATARVYTPEGPVSLGEAVAKRVPRVLGYVNGRIEMVDAIDWVSIGERELVRVTTRGWSLDAAATHPVLTARGWVKAGDLEEGDHVAMASHLPLAGSVAMSEDEALLAGYLIGDGSLGTETVLTAQHPWKQEEFARVLGSVFPGARVVAAHGRVSLCRGEPREAANLRVAARIADAGWSIWELLHSNTPRFLRGESLLDAQTIASIEARGVELGDYLAYLSGRDALGRWAADRGLCGRAAEKTLGVLDRIETQLVPHLLAALWFTDGHVARGAREVSYSTASIVLAQQVRDLLARCGIQSALRRKLVAEVAYYTVALTAKGASEFRRVVPLRGPKAQRLSSAPESLGQDTSSNADSLPFEVWHPEIGADPRTHSWRASRSGMSRSKFVELGGRSDIADREVWFVPVSSVERLGAAPCFDLEVDTEEHAFVADGAIVHNSTLLELFPGALHRRTPTRGSLSDLATARDAYVEAHVVNGQPWTIRHTLDAVNGKSEALVLDAEGRPAFETGKVRDFDRWAAKHLPSAEVLLASTFAAQKGGGFAALSTSERKAVLLRLLGIERLEVLAEAARERHREARTALAATVARMTDAEARVAALRGRIDRELPAAQERLSQAERDVAALGEELEAEYDAVAALAKEEVVEQRRAELEARMTELGAAFVDVERRVENNERLLADRAAVEAAVAREAELVELLASLTAAATEADALLARTEAGERLAAAAHADARARLRDAERELERARGLAAGGDAARAARDAAAGVDVAGAELRVAEVRRSLDEVTEQHLAGAGERIEALRTALVEIVDEAGDPTEIAEAALAEDDQADGEPERRRAAVEQLQRELVEATARLEEARRERRRLEGLAAALPRIEAAEAELGARERAVEEAARAVEHAEEADRAAAGASLEATSAAVRARQDRAKAQRDLDALAPTLRLREPLAAAEARLAELRPRLAELQAEVQAVRAAASELPERVSRYREPDVAGAEAALAKAEAEERAARDAVTLLAGAERELETALATVTAIEVTRRIEEDDVADWAHLAEALGRDGIQALEVDAAGPELTELTNDLLHQAFGTRFTVRFDTTRSSADGKRELEAFDIQVLDTERAREGGIESLSGGEAVVVGEAISLALSAMACRRSGIERPTLVRDESGAALDEANGPRYVAMLRRAGELLDARHVLFVAHSRAMQELADVRLVVRDGRVEAAS